MILQWGEIANNVHLHLEVGQYKFKRVQEFKYLGSLLTQNNVELTEIKTKILE